MLKGFTEWVARVMPLRRFAFINIWFWAAQHPIVVVWYVYWHESFVNGGGVLYIATISIAALWIGALSWYAAEKVKADALTVDELVEETTVERS